MRGYPPLGDGVAVFFCCLTQPEPEQPEEERLAETSPTAEDDLGVVEVEQRIAQLADRGRLLAIEQGENETHILTRYEVSELGAPMRKELAMVDFSRDTGLTLLDMGMVDQVVFYDKPFLKFERLLETYLAYAPSGFKSFLSAMPVWLKEKLLLKDTLRRELAGLEFEILEELEREVHEGKGHDGLAAVVQVFARRV